MAAGMLWADGVSLYQAIHLSQECTPLLARMLVFAECEAEIPGIGK
jgi:hypothetical protein